MSSLKSRFENWRLNGLIKPLSFLPRFFHIHILRPRLPKGAHTTLSGYPIPAERCRYHWGDRWVPWETPVKTELNPGYEEALLTGIHSAVHTGDNVVIIGGGWGISSIVAAKCAGENGAVNVYEGSRSEVSKIKKTVRLNNVSEHVSINHAIVCKAVSLRGCNDERPKIIKADDLPPCNTLAIDCDGAEFDILKNLTSKPRSIVVEHHMVKTDSQMIEYKPNKIKDMVTAKGDHLSDTYNREYAPKGTSINPLGKETIFVFDRID